MLLSPKQSYLDVSTLRSYLEHKITNWYDNAKRDYSVSGKFKNISSCGEHLNITWEEVKKTHSLDIAYFNDYSMEQIYNIWMEAA